MMPWYHFHFLKVQTEVVKFMSKMAHFIPCASDFYHVTAHAGASRKAL
jgi:hypothetical protein